MIRNDDTLPEPQRRALLRANFVDDAESRHVVDASLDHDNERVRVLALRAGAHHGWITAQRWRQALSDPAAAVRREGATLLSRTSDHEELDLQLIGALDDTDPLVVDAAAFALGERRSSRGVESLIEIARSHDDARCRESAIASLGMIGDDRARAVLLAALSDKAPIRRRAVVALSNFEGDDIDAALNAAREDRDWQVRAAIDQLERGPLDDS